MILPQIVDYKKEELAETKRRVPVADLKAKLLNLPPSRDFAYALCPAGGGCGKGISIIAEIKQASPSRGIIREDFEPSAIARIYQANGAAAVSVLTEQRFFMGSLNYLSVVRQVTALPLLRKDFIFDDYQVYESRANGADALLLIAAILSPSQIQDLYYQALELGLCPLIEVHTARELDRVLLLDPKIVGINNRDLKTFKTDLNLTLSMLSDIPHDKIVVSESGIRTREDIEKLGNAGVSAVLIGEELMRSPDIGLRLRQLLG